MNEKTLPKWFKGNLYKKGDIVTNRFSGEEYDLTAVELSMYDFIIGATIVIEMEQSNPEIVKDLRKGLDWFRKNNIEAYKILFD